ncbi:helicase-associated domain-containing protein [Paenibacillaceae bacterium WGS1546]|uniref:helicase-associated domain-containing protein n=1 Tax=Cohnella sp. WGS1546 TaxID=3366810 RepID=UPI00372CF42B
MNVKESVARLAEPVERLVRTDPAVRSGLERGLELEAVLSSFRWAEEWLSRCSDSAARQALKTIVAGFGSQPFEEEQLVRRMAGGEWNGAEIRVALARLRRSGIVFAVRKAWGDRLYYLPSDAVPLWQPLLLPLGGRPLSEEEAREATAAQATYRPPLSLELLQAWQAVHRQPVTLTLKGTPNRTAISRIAASLTISDEELASLGLAYPCAEHVPPKAALALDLGLCFGVLRQSGDAIEISEDGLEKWLSLSSTDAERRLQRAVAGRYLPEDPAFQLTVSAALGVAANEWHAEAWLAELNGRATETPAWLSLLAAFGWLELGKQRGGIVYRKPADPSAAQGPNAAEPALIVQPDGEILALPGTGPRTRWLLLELAETETADAVWVCRLTKRSCENAYRAGRSLESALSFLESRSGRPVPPAVAGALRDWFATFGQTRIAEETLLRTESREVADALSRDPELAALIVERLGDKAFVIASSSAKLARDRLRLAGYPPDEPRRAPVRPDGPVSECAGPDPAEEKGWIYRRTAVSVFEADRSVPGAEELFPGLGDIPAAWITRPRTYHPSTSKELLRRAIGWNASVQMEHSGERRVFVPTGLREEGPDWTATGWWRIPSADGIPGTGLAAATLRADEVAEAMIVMPPLEEIETD